ncbi:MAG: HAD domain-containing protein [Candidatus Algichlamydia australiensis]|nr:HAD domain-containing protein [Chlamydiales bacterium]
MSSLPISSIENDGLQKDGYSLLSFRDRIFPEEDSRETVSLFLDVDGVLLELKHPKEAEIAIRNVYSEVSQLKDEEQYRSLYKVHVEGAKYFNSAAVANLHELINRIEGAGYRVLVIISSSWRNFATLQQLQDEVFAGYDFAKYICGKTPPDSQGRECSPECRKGFEFEALEGFEFEGNYCERVAAILSWLEHHGLQNSKYLAIDDWGALAALGNRFYHVNGDKLLTEDDVKGCLAALKID